VAAKTPKGSRVFNGEALVGSRWIRERGGRLREHGPGRWLSGVRLMGYSLSPYMFFFYFKKTFLTFRKQKK
jgi:hypothetical protein